MTIAFFITTLAGGGAERVVSRLSNYYVENGYNVLLILFYRTLDYDLDNRIKIISLYDSEYKESGLKKIMGLLTLPSKLKNVIKEKNIQVVYAFMNRPSYIAALTKKIYANFDLVINERTNPSYMYPQGGLTNSISRWSIKKLYPIADVVVANSSAAGKTLVEEFGISLKKVKVIFNPIDFLEKNKHKPQEDKFIILNIGRLEPVKDQEHLIKAYSQIANSANELWIAGKGTLEKELKVLVKKEGLEKNVRFLGFINDIASIATQCHCFVNTSKFEGFPNVILEAMACGLPIITTMERETGVRDLIDPEYRCTAQEYNGSYGILLIEKSIKNTSDMMFKLMNNKQLQKELSALSLLRSEDYTIDEIANQYSPEQIL